ncbi:DNA polymerase IV [Amphibacillus xylanus]|uniref:DNA polymerase IV n=1 Tax=Amphibacillus xylanus (strain ATCC 51415 / DSM 6626 / JCM 7361 / LMG 17667 / NBRC 15112 / Ep01) TaxID=698758 RepID=K0IX20_AMPXN|nr:DNA polymerase IV [Amphibacillus xylanus]BAM46990.1 putative UmuC-like protein [Amphibacillus xylanus NBRC 15112]
MSRTIFLVDMQSFYASVEKVSHPALQNKPVIVAGDPKQRSGIVLAACPLAKKFGVKTAESLWEAKAKCPELEVIQPHMSLYLKVSYEITKILEQYSDLVEVYSVDEQFLDVTNTIHLFKTKEQLAKQIHDEIFETIGVESRIGIGPNKVLAKMACDNFAKKNRTGVAELNESNLKSLLWPLPINALFGVGGRMRVHLTNMGLHTIGNLAQYPVKWLQKRWGINGEVLWRLANGIDQSPVVPRTHQTQKAIGHHMTLPRDYEAREDIYVVIKELSEEVARRVRKQNYLGLTVSLQVQSNRFKEKLGFNRQLTLREPTQLGRVINETAKVLFDKYWLGYPVRALGISLAQLMPKTERQLSFFDDPTEEEQLAIMIDRIRERYGLTAIMNASSLLDAGQARIRATKIGGHNR